MTAAAADAVDDSGGVGAGSCAKCGCSCGICCAGTEAAAGKAATAKNGVVKAVASQKETDVKAAERSRVSEESGHGGERLLSGRAESKSGGGGWWTLA